MIDRLPLTEVVSSASATVAVAALAILYRPVTQHLLLVWAVATSVVLVELGHATAGLLFGVALTAAARFVVSQPLCRAFLAAGVLTVVFVLTRDLSAQLQVGALVTAAAAGPLLWHAYRTFGQAPTLTVLAGSALGIYVNVPDTEQIAVHAAGLVVLAAVTLSFRQISFGPIWFGTLALVAALVICAGAVGARGRPPSFIGVIGALGVLLAEPAAAVLRRNTRAHHLVLIAVHAVAVLIASRIAGVRDPAEATLIVAAVLAGAVVLLALLARQQSVADL